MRLNLRARVLQNGLALLLSVCLSLISVGSLAQNEPEKDGRYYEAAARKAYQDKDYPTFLEDMKLAAQLRPNHPRLMYNLAVAYALNGQRAEALASLAKVAALGMVVRAASDQDFASIRDSAEFKAIAARIEANQLPVGKSTPAFTIHEKGLVPESVAFDPATNLFFVSSIYKRKIMRITKDGSVSDFAVEADGLWSVFGMKVDSARRVLWACTAAHPQMSHYDANEDGRSAILKFDLRTGKLVKKYLLPNDSGKHLLGDLVLNAGGDVFASDSLSPTIYFLRAGAKELEVFVASKSFVSPQGLAFSADEKNLFLADYSNGIFVINMKTRKITNCPAPPDGTLLGIDGLYNYRGEFIAVQNGVNPQRVVRLSLTPDLGRIKRVETIAANQPEFDEPTLGVLVKDSFYFVANSQWGAIDEKGQLASEDKLKEPIILKLKLSR